MQDHIKNAIEVLKNGGIVIYPTDTAFGIGCRIDDRKAIQKLFSIRKRPSTQAMPVLCNSVKMIEEYVTEIPEQVNEKLMAEYWPGAVTIVLPANTEKVPELVRGGSLTVGVRIPNHIVPLSLIAGVGVPILGSSANFHGQPTPYQFADVDPQLMYLADYIVPGVCDVARESTVVDTTVTPWKILRQGAISIDL